MAIDNPSQGIELRLEVIAKLRDAIQQVGELGDAGDKTTDRLSRDLTKAVNEFDGLGKAAKNAGGSISRAAEEGSSEWRGLTKSLRDAGDAYRAFRRNDLTGTEDPAGKGVSGYSIDELRQFIAVQDAASASFISAARDRVRVSDSIGDRIEAAEARATNALNKTAAAEKAALDIRLSRARSTQHSDWDEAFGSAEREANDRQQLAREVVAAEGRMEAAVKQRVAAETAARRQSSSIAKASWDAEFNALSEATRRAGGLFRGLSDSELPRLRYALYDVSSTALITAASITAVGAATFAAAGSFESAFTGVERTLDPAFQGVDKLRGELLQMSRDTPKSFVDLSAIATLGNQLGISGEQVGEFTDTVSKFSTVSGMTAEASALAFGRLTNILQYPIGDAEKLASAIELVGISSASTDQEIIALAQRLGASATRAGFAADQVIGLAGALGSLGVAPERAQGVFETYFNSLNESLSEGGKKLEAFSAITGTTVDELQTLVRTGQGFEVFQRFLSGLQGADTVQLTSSLETLGLSGLRANEVIGRISQNLPLLQKAFGVAAKGAAEGTELNRQYALILDDLNSKWQILVNGALEFAAAIGAAVAPAAKVFLDLITELLHGLTDFINTPIGGSLAQTAVIFAVVTAAVATTVGGLALFGASLAAVRTAIVALGLQSFVARLGAVAGGLFGTSAAAWAAASNMGKLRIAVIGLMRATVVLGLIQLIVSALFDLRGAGNLVVDVLSNVLTTLISVGRAASAFISGLPGDGVIQQWAKDWGSGLQAAQKQIGNFRRDAKKEWGNFSDDMGWVTESVDDFADGAFDATDAGYGLGDAFDDVGNSADEAAAKVRTLADYASDLGTVMSRASDIRYGGMQGLDTITTGWTNIRDAAEAATKAARDHQNTLAGLKADANIKQYWLSVAEMYGDELRAAKLRADLAEINGKVADTSKELATEQQKASMTLSGNSAAAIANRAAILGLVGNYSQYLQALAASGVSQEELSAKSAELKQEFINQATQMGYNRSEVDLYAASFDDMKLAIDRVPRDITVTANVNPAIQALNEFAANAQAQMGSLGYNLGAAIGEGLSSGIPFGIEQGIQKWRMSSRPELGASLPGSRSRTGGGSFSVGGYTGGGGTSDIAGVVHKREFVFSAPATRNIGVNNLSNLHQAAKSGRPFMSGNSGPGGPTGPMDLTPGTIQALAAAVAPALFLDGQRLTNNVGMHNATSTALGAN